MESKRLFIRYFSILLSVLILLPFLNNVAYAAGGNYVIDGDSYELSDASEFNTSGQKATVQMCYGAESIGKLVLSGSINEQTTYNKWDAIGATGDVSLTYTYNGAYQTDNKDTWNLSSSTGKNINGNNIDKKIEKGAIVIERSKDGIVWDTVFIKTNVFHKANSNIADFYTISDEEIRGGSYFRVSVAYRMEKRTETEKIMGFIPKDIFEYREFVEISEFYICYNANAVVLREIESGQQLSSNSVQKGFIVDKCGTNIKVIIKDNATGKEKTVNDLTSIIEPGSYKITTTTNLGENYSSSITVTEGMNMSSVSPNIYTNDKYQLDSSGSKPIPFGMSSLTTLKLGYQFDARLTSDSVSGFKAYGITGDSLSLFLRIKDFSKSENNGWMISSDAWGKKDKQKIVNTWAGVVGTGALVIQTSKDGITWNDVDDGKYENGIYTADFYTHYGDQGDVLIYTPDGKELQQGIYVRILYAYQVEKVGSKQKTRVLEAYEMYLCSNELSAVTFHNMSVSDTLKETLGLDNEADVEVYKKAETLVSGSGTVTGFSIDTSLNPTVKYSITRNGVAVSKTRDNRYTTNGKYDIRLESAVGSVETITIYVDSQSNESALKHYFGSGFITSDSKRIYSEGEYPVYESGLVTLHVEPNQAGYLPLHGTVQNQNTGSSFDINAGNTAVSKILEEPGQYVATFTTRPVDDGNALPGDYRVFTFRFEVIAQGTAPGPVVNKESLSEYAKTTATDSYPKFYGLTYPSAAAGDITLAFATKEAAADYAYNYEKGTVEVQDDGSYRYTGSFLFAQKEKYDSAWDLTDAMYYFAEQAVQELQFDLSDQFTYLTLSEDTINNTNNLRTLELRRSVTIFGEEQRELLCNIDALPIISPKPYAYLTPGSNGKVDEGYLDFEFVSDKYGCDSSSIVIIDSTGKEYQIAYNTGVGKQLADYVCPSGIVTIKEKTIYGDETTYEAVYIAEGDNTASISLTCYKDGEKNTATYTQTDDGATITVDAFELTSIADSHGNRLRKKRDDKREKTWYDRKKRGGIPWQAES